MNNDHSGYDIFSEERSSRYTYSKWSWLREKVATRDFGYCLVLSISVIALLALISANGRKTTRLGELEGRINSLDLELRNSTNSTHDLRARLEEDLEEMNKNITKEMVNLKLGIDNNTREVVDLRDSINKETTTQKTTPATMETPKLNEGSKKNGTSNAGDDKA